MSTLSSLINSIATLFTLDIYHKYVKPKATQKHLIRTGQIAGTVMLLLGTIWAPMIQTFPTIFDYFQQCWAIMAAPYSVIFLLAIFWRRANNTGAISTMILGIIAIPVTFWLQRSVLPEGFNFYNLVGIICLVLLVWMVIVSFLTQPQVKVTIAEVIWSHKIVQLPARELPHPYLWYKKVWLWWGIATILTCIVYIIFW